MHKTNFEVLQNYLESQIIGQKELVKQLMIALLADGHILVEGPPGLAKTRAVKSLADCVEGDFHRIQFTPDLLPADLTGTDIFRPETGEFTFQSGPIFNSLILADEINRAPAKVQAAMLEAMAEKQVTAGRKTYALPELFLVMATQNPIEQEGTYPLPEAQLDRFLLHLEVEYPDMESELEILRLNRGEAQGNESIQPQQISQQTIFEARQEVLNIHMADTIEQYIIRLVMATRQPKQYSDQLDQWLDMGVSPRATIALDRCARAHAWLAGRDYVTPQDVQAMAFPVLRHRLLRSYHAQAEGVTANQVIAHLISLVGSA
ncbi:AAA family ATPase [Vibrio cyclitrophicus]|uniref:AAA family ATPase n=5 Tax=Vibrio TaxID=662 RepID=A0A7Z1S041_9VIBR|nr:MULTISPECIES: MoxR family ATPase [Vibrio]KNH10886.1 ATPase AAA [Vibrio lentus]MBY7659580.1 AAA family ATPase [Vibrio atlanticus]ERM58182.1 MoxR-like ATPase in aerotolerance operon [Vibrio cyclitrophicus FF75]KAA8602596.1 MoxR-like ATPase in aerotolerance operon [Vibrio cyclitrophicus]MBE8558121.1 AAA family ATPase [Vibrio sp. OPT24]|tara:strand:+ start:1652 stop:2608 length:957 start_codon:yes stop_codon:yes gene_type:complete